MPDSARSHVRYLPLTALTAARPSGDATLRSLFDSVLEFGVLQPLLVRQVGAGFVVIDGAKRLAVAHAAGLRDLPCIVLEVGERDATSIAEAVNAQYRAVSDPPQGAERSRDIPASVVAELRDAHRAVATCLSLSASAPAGLRRRVATRLMESELQRVGWIAETMALAGGGVAPSPAAALSALNVLRTVTASFKADCELGGIDTRLSIEPVDLIVVADESSLTTVLTSALGATLSLIHEAQVSMPELRISAGSTDQGVVFSIAQNVFGPDRYLPVGRGDRTTPPSTASFALATVRRAAEARSWRVAMAARAEGGATFELTVSSDGA